MTEYIHWKLDEEEPIDPADPLGNITIAGDEGILKEQDIFVDSFLEALVKGLNLIETQDTIRVDLIDEPDELVFLKKEKGIQIKYKNQNVTILDDESFSHQLSSVIRSFLTVVDQASQRMGKEKFDFIKLRGYINKVEILNHKYESI